MQRREVFTAWVLLSAPITGFVAYLVTYLGLQIGQSNAPLVAALTLAVACLLFLSWAFISHTDADWRKTTRFIAIGLLVEGLALVSVVSAGRGAALYFGIGSMVFGLALLLAAKRH